MKLTELNQTTKLEAIAILSGWISEASQDIAVAETPPLEWWGTLGIDGFSDNVQTLVEMVTEKYTIPEMIGLIKHIAATL